MQPMVRYGKKIVVESTTAIKHQLRARMQRSDLEDSERVAREQQAPAPAPTEAARP